MHTSQINVVSACGLARFFLHGEFADYCLKLLSVYISFTSVMCQPCLGLLHNVVTGKSVPQKGLGDLII